MIEKMEEFKKIWIDCFNDDENYIEWYFKNIFRIENTLSHRLPNGKLVGGLHINRYKMMIEKMEGECSFILGVGILPEYRGRGIMRDLFHKLLRDSYRKGEELHILTAIDKGIYEQFGYGLISYLYRYKVPFNLLKDYRIKKDVEEISEGDITDTLLGEIVDIYLEFSKDYKFYIKRGRKDFKALFLEILSEGGKIYIFKESGKIKGYTLFYKNENIMVKELIFLDRDTLETALKLFYGYINYYEELYIVLPKDIYLELFLKSDVGLEKKGYKYLFGRVIDIEGVLKRVSARLESDDEIVIEIRDNIIEENNGIFLVRKNSIERVEKEIDLSLDIKDLVMLTYGFNKIANMEKIGGTLLFNKKKSRITELIFSEGVTFFNQDI